MTYDEQLKDPRWLALREVIIRRDLHACKRCGRPKNLQVHHKRYKSGLMAWEYDHDDLETLCRKCHMWEHDIIADLDDVCKPSRETRTIREVMIDFVHMVAGYAARDENKKK